MKFIRSKNPDEGAKLLAERISADLKADKRVLWLIPGGSNIPISVKVMDMVRKDVAPDLLNNLTLTLTDERYGPVGHPDSNWQQLKLSGLDLGGVNSIPVLTGLSLEDTVGRFSKDIESAFVTAHVIIGQFGIGPDGHIAGILPRSKAVTSEASVFSYDAPNFMRITMTPKILTQISCAFAFAFGETKIEPIFSLRFGDLSVSDEPAVILKHIKEAYLFSDQILD